MQQKQVQAQYLKKGDYLPGIASTVIVEPSSGLLTPTGKVDLVVKNKHDKLIPKQWNKQTEITVLVK